MKRIILAISVVAAIAACKNNESKIPEGPLTDSVKQAVQKDTANFTTVEWVDSTFKDLGKVKKGQTVEVPFIIKNTGSKPLVISSVQPGCGCTVADKPEKPIMPGKEEKIVAKFNSENQNPGPHTKYVTVMANTQPSAQHSLTFKVEVTP